MAIKINRPPTPEPSPRALPLPEVVRDTLSDLLMRPCSVTKSDSTNVALLGVFCDASGKPLAALGADWSFCALSAAALAMMPASTALEQAAAKELDETLQSCFFEVVNVLSRLLNGESVSHLKLTELLDASSPLLLEMEAGRSRHLEITIESYGTGKMSIYSLG